MQVEKFIPSYPVLPTSTKKHFEYEIARKKEFADLRLSRFEDDPSVAGDYYYAQQIFEKYFSPYTPYKDGLIVHSTGTGKSCLIAILGEAFKNVTVNGAKRGRTLVLLKSDALVDDIKYKIAQVCTKAGTYGVYRTAQEKKKNVGLSAKQERRRVSDLISKNYEIVTFEKFLKKISKLNTSSIKVLYSNRIIVVDEAHNLRLNNPSDKDAKGQYKALFKLFHSVQNCRKFLLTATPLVDTPDEIADLLNLFQSAEKQLPTKKKFISQYFVDGKFEPDRTLKNAIRGKVSYLRAKSDIAKQIELGQTLPYTKYVKVVPCPMSDFQSQAVKEASERESKVMMKHKDKDGNEHVKEKKNKGGPLLSYARQSSNFVFPDKSYGNEGYDKFAKKTVEKIKDGKRIKVENVGFDNKMKEEVADHLEKYSAKFAAIVNELKKNPTELAYIYCESVRGSGALILALCLQAHGMTWAKKAPNVPKEAVDVPFEGKQKTFAVITSHPATTSDTGSVNKMLEAFNNPNNRYGDYVQCIIGSEKTSEGFTLKNVRQFMVVMPHWNLSSLDQASGRVLRNMVFDALPQNERYVKILRFVAVNKEDAKSDSDDMESITETPDLYVYRIAEDKDKKNTAIMRFLKEMSFDCSLTYNRNVLENDVDGTRTCDYQKCDYVCFDFDEEKIGRDPLTHRLSYKIENDQIDRTTYDLLYATKQIMNYRQRIELLFQDSMIMTFDDIMTALEIDEKDTIPLLQALDYIIGERIPINNKFGFVCYLKEENDIYFLDYSIDFNISAANASYVQWPMVYNEQTLEKFVNDLQFVKDKDNLRELCKCQKGKYFDVLHYKTKVFILEFMYSLRQVYELKNQKFSEEQQKLFDEIHKRFGDKIYKQENKELDIDVVYFHNLLATEYTGISYSVASKNLAITSGKLRALNKRGFWYFIENSEDELKLLDQIKERKVKKKERAEEKKDNVDDEKVDERIRGTVSQQDGRFRIIQPNNKRSRGITCTTMKKHIILILMRDSNVKAKNIPDDIKEASKDTLIDRMKSLQEDLPDIAKGVEKMSTEKLRNFAALASMTKEDLCNLFREFLEGEGLLEVV